MSGLNTILDIGSTALFGAQAAINVTGNNIANVNTPGYSRQRVLFDENSPLDFYPGQLGTGSVAKEVIRYFDGFIEAQYNTKASTRDRYQALYANLQAVDSLFNESNTSGLNTALTQFFADWQELSLRPEDLSAREALIGHTTNLVSIINNAKSDLQRMQDQMNDFIGQEVDDVNGLIKQIADINLQISNHDIPGVNNANTLYDNRAQLVRELATKMDINVIDNGGGEFKILTKAGQTLVDGTVTYDIKFEGPKTYMSQTAGSTFDGDIAYSGTDSHEYTIEFLTSGQVSNAGSAATFRVSLDGGKTWLEDADGNQAVFSARPDDEKVDVGELTIWFDAGSGNDIQAGDTWTIVPKNGLYWYKNTSSFMNITPQIAFDGQDDSSRLTGGILTGYCNFRDAYVGKYEDQLDALAETLAWEVNRMHSQGAGLTKIADLTGTYEVRDSSLPLGSESSGLHWFDKLSEGNAMIYCYDKATGELASSASFGPLDFDMGTAGIQNFDPAVHSLEDVRDALNANYGGFLTASITNNKLRIQANDGYEYAFGTDTSGLFAGLGLNTFFNGTDGTTLAFNSEVTTDLNHINAGAVNGAGEANTGDNVMAKAVADLAKKDVTVSTTFSTTSNQTLQEYVSTLVATVGADTASAKYAYAYQNTLASDLNDRQEEMAGVNLDEEMSNLIKYQHSYRAAAKLITTADEMFNTLLGLKN
ncbi:MAG: flagellar hook-associated protein FlgK [Desulfovibrionaceae bacterium]|jgi:flagellar hook-associated protein 1 FlgK|nr:flagellar hook-associated protein FlgK [Desulfovibrionaceae bacterium]